MKRVFISQPMKGKTEKQILEKRMEAIDKVADIYSDEEVIIGESYNKDYSENKNPLRCLSKSLEIMSTCDVCVFVEGWDNARGCKIEHECAKQYGYNILYI